jgi:hypothetical protein
MLIRITLAFAIIAALGLAFAVAVSPVSPATPPPRQSGLSVPDSRVFMLMPDGRVEITDDRARRVFRWDGEQWVEVDGVAALQPVSTTQ